MDDGTDYLTRYSTATLTGKAGYPTEKMAEGRVTLNRTVTSGEDSNAIFDDGGDSSDGEDDYDWVEVVAMSCEDPSPDESFETRPGGKRKKQKHFIKEWRVNEDVQLAKMVEGNLFNATIEAINKDGTLTIRFKDTELMMTSGMDGERVLNLECCELSRLIAATNDNTSSDMSPPHESVEKHTQDSEEMADNIPSKFPIKRALFNHIVKVNTSVISDACRPLRERRVNIGGKNGLDTEGVSKTSGWQARETSVDGISLVQDNQVNYCPFCKECHRDLSDHLTDEHANSVQVKRWLKKKKKQSKAWLLKKMQNMGNYRYNCDIIRAGSGKLIVGQPVPEGSVPSDFSPCPGCLGFFNRKLLLEHECVTKSINDLNSRMTVISDSQLLLPLSHEMANSVSSFVAKSAQEIGDIIASDSLLCELSHREFARLELDEEKSTQVTSKILDLSKLLAELDKSNSPSNNMQETIDPNRSQEIVTGLKNFCDSNKIEDEDIEAFVKLISSLRECGVVQRARALEDGNWLLHERSLKFIDLCDSWLLETTDRRGNQETLTQALTTDIVRTFTEDVVRLWRYLCEVCTYHRQLLEDENTNVSSSELRQLVFTFSKVVLTKVLLFNKENEDCIAKMKLKDFSSRHPPRGAKVEDVTSLNWKDHMFNSLVSVFLKDDTGTQKTVLLTEDMVECIDLLISKRGVAYISPGNKEIFTLALFSIKGNPITASECVEEFSNSCGLVFHNLVIFPLLSKALEVAVQLTCLSKEDSKLVANYFGDHFKEDEENVTLNKETLQILNLMKPLLDHGVFLSPTVAEETGRFDTFPENLQVEQSLLEERSVPSSHEGSKTTSKRKLLEDNVSCLDEDGKNGDDISEKQEVSRKRRKKQEDEVSRKRKKEQKENIQRTKNQKNIQKARKPFVGQCTVKNGVRQWDKKYYCLFCGEPSAKLPRHLRNRHPTVPLVVEWMAETDLSKKLALLAKIRNLGNCKHNCQVLREGVGRLIVVRRPSAGTDPGQFAPCPDCYGFYTRTNLWQHACPVSVFNKIDEGVRNRLALYGKLLLPVSSTSSQDVLTWLAFLKRNEFVDTFVEDWVICEFAQKDLAGKTLRTSRLQVARAKLKLLASVLLKLREKNGNQAAELQDFLEPSRFPEVEEVIKALTEYNEATSRYSKPQVAEKMWQYVKMCSTLIRGTLLELGQLSRLQLAWSFGRLCDAKILEAAKQCPLRSEKPHTTEEGDSKEESGLALDVNINLEDWDVSGDGVDLDSIAKLVEGEDVVEFVTGLDDQNQSQVQEVEENEEESDEITEKGKSYQRKLRKKKRFYSEEEKEAVWRHLGDAIKLGRTPGKKEVMRCKLQEPALKNRTWSNIKFFCKNTSKAREKAKLKDKTKNSLADRLKDYSVPDKNEEKPLVESWWENSDKVKKKKRQVEEPDEDESGEQEEVENQVNDSEEEELRRNERQLKDGDTENESDAGEIEERKERLQIEGEDDTISENVEREEADGERDKRSYSGEVEEIRERESIDGDGVSENPGRLEETSKDEGVDESYEVVARDRRINQRYGLKKIKMKIRKVSLTKEHYEDEDGLESEEGEVDDGEKEDDDDSEWEPEGKKTLNDGDSEDEEYIPFHTFYSKGNIPMPRRVTQKRPWSEEEKTAVYRHLEAFISSDALPGKDDIMNCKDQECVLNERTWKNIKDFCRNAALARRRKEKAKKEIEKAKEEISLLMELGPPRVEMEPVSKKRGRATPEERQAIQKHFKVILRGGLLPSRKVIEKIMRKEKIFDGRSWRQVREFCIKERKKLQAKRAKGILS